MEDDKDALDYEGIPNSIGFDSHFSISHDIMHRNPAPSISRSFSGTSPSFHHIHPPALPRASIASFDLSSLHFERSAPAANLKRTNSTGEFSSNSSLNNYSEFGSYSVASSPSNVSLGASYPGNDVASNMNLSFPLSRSVSNLQNFADENIQGMRRVKSVPAELHCLDNVGIFFMNSYAYIFKDSNSKSSRRLARKAEAARQSRRRKKAHMQSLEEKFARLSARLIELESAAESSQSKKIESELNEQEKIKQKLESILLSPDVFERIDDVRELVQLYISSDRYKENEIELLLKKIQNSLKRSSQFKKHELITTIPDDFFNYPDLIREVLKTEGTVTEDQMNEMKNLKQQACTYISSAQNLIARIEKLKGEISSHLARRQEHAEEIMKLLTPLQVGKLCMWVNNNPLCMQMLNTVWRC
jgi:hypothetical protein